MTKAAAKTGADPIFIVAVEQFFPKDKRIIEDDLALQILPLSIRVVAGMMRYGFIRDWLINYSEKTTPGIWGGILCRKRYIRDKLTDMSNQIDGVVNLGAGFDTTVYTLDSISKLPIWELDQNVIIKSKQLRITKIFGSLPNNVQSIGIDFDREDIGKVLEKNGYSSDKKMFFIWEAVTQYLEEKSVRQIFDFLSHARSGSKIAFTYVRKEFLDGSNMYGMEDIYKRFVENKTWIFGMDPEAWPQFLEEYGWKIIEDIGAEDLKEKYVKPTGRILESTPIERMIFAEKI
jgi:methyltransferase (TIGR00027 family)